MFVSEKHNLSLEKQYAILSLGFTDVKNHFKAKSKHVFYRPLQALQFSVERLLFYSLLNQTISHILSHLILTRKASLIFPILPTRKK